MVALVDTPLHPAPVPLSELVLTDPYGAQVLPDERLHHLFEARCDWVTGYGPPGHLAVDTPELALSYAELDARANRLARHLRRRGVRAGERIGLLLDRAADTCVAVLAVLKLGAACVPLEGVAAGVDLEGARVRRVLTTGTTADRLPRAGVDAVDLDQAACLIDLQDPRRFAGEARTADADRTAFVLHHAGPDGGPVAVAVDHSGLCAVVRSGAEVSGLSSRDRVGVSIAGGAAAEQMWATWACGATLVPAGPADRRITALWCDPEVLAALDDRPGLRVLLVDGPCPAELVARWYRPDRRLLDVFRPPGAVATALWAERQPGRAPALGVPLPAFSTVVLDVADPCRILRHGAVGEVGLAGIGLGCGYLDRSDLPGSAVPDPLGIPGNPSGVIHRTGVLGRVGPEQQLEHHGRVGVRPLPSVLPATPPAPSAEPSVDPAAGLAVVLAEVLGVAVVPEDDHFFDDLGADSMVMARFCGRVRKRPDLPSPSIKDVYRNPTLRSLATALGGPVPVVTSVAPAAEAAPAGPVVDVAPVPAEVPRTSTAAYVTCSALQLLVILGYPALQLIGGLAAVEWAAGGTDLLGIYLRSVVAGAAFFAALCVVPILVKWLLVGRWRPHDIGVWTPTYLRFWVVRVLVQRNPMAMFVGSPLYPMYLRALGAHVGRGVVILSRNVPVCTDLLRIGDGSVIRKDSFFSGYRARDGVIETGTVTLGREVLVGEATVLDISTRIGDRGQLGHTSSLQTGQIVPVGECWHGSPARPATVDYRTVPTARGGRVRRVVFPAMQLVNLLVVGLPVTMGGLALLGRVPRVAALLDGEPAALTSRAFYLQVSAGASVAFFGFVVVGLLVVTTVPRLLGLLVREDRVYPLYGIRYWAHRALSRLTNLRFFAYLFGDSSYIVGYLRGVGYDLSEVEQTGSNFGQRVKHETPFLVTVGTGTIVADGLSIVNADFSATSFRVSRASIGAGNFLGNNIVYPAQGRTGDNCLLATKAMVPIDGPVRENVGLLGSPSFEIPRSVRRDIGLELGSAAEQRRRLRAKNRHNLVTMALFLLVRWMAVVLLALVATITAQLESWGLWPLLTADVAVVLGGVLYAVLVERSVLHLEALVPTGCSIYDRAFWRHERFWKVPLQGYLPLFNGTPLKTLIWRLLGVRMGKRVFDDGCAFVEKTFVTIGDGCTLNAGSIVQCHSQEDGAFKSDRSVVGAGVTIGVGALVHYGVTMGDGAELQADSFLMKGEAVPAGARWGGNPAMELGRGRPIPSAQVRRRSR